MSPNAAQLIVLLSGLLSYIVNIYFIFNLLKVDYFNPVVKIFVKLFKPVSQLLFFIPNQIMLALIVAVFLKFIGFYVAYGSKYAIGNLLGIAFLATVNITLQILLYSIIGAVIVSWVAQNNEHPLLKVIGEISDKILYPIKNVIPAMGGLDISPLFGLILIQYLQAFVGGIIQSLA